MKSNFGYPYQLDDRGLTDMTDADRHVRGMLEMLLLTTAGERVNRPNFGGGISQLLFGPVSPELAATVQHTLRAEVLQWLDDLIDLRDLDVEADENRLVVSL